MFWLHISSTTAAILVVLSNFLPCSQYFTLYFRPNAALIVANRLPLPIVIKLSANADYLCETLAISRKLEWMVARLCYECVYLLQNLLWFSLWKVVMASKRDKRPNYSYDCAETLPEWAFLSAENINMISPSLKTLDGKITIIQIRGVGLWQWRKMFQIGRFYRP